MRRKSSLVFGGIALIALALIGVAYTAGIHHAENNESSNSDYPLLAKRIQIDQPNDSFVNFSGLRSQFKQYFDDNKLTGSLYFEYLPTGTSIRITGDQQEVGASLLKVPAAMELYKAAEMGKISLDKTVTIQEDWLDSKFGDLYKKGAGYQLTLRDATKIMLEHSDNTALNVISYTTNGLLSADQTPVTALDVDIAVNSEYDILVGARSYTSFFKCLYFSCYLSKQHSQELLNYLSHTIYTSRLPAGVPDKSIVIAHKIGNFGQQTQSDCGIIYLPNRNYTLCVMINGPDDATTDAKIAALSNLAYTFVNSKESPN